MHRLLPGLLLLLVAATAVGGPSLTPLADLRVRQEILDGVYHFDPNEPDRDWIRVRARAGLRFESGVHRIEARLDNEHRRVFTPDDSEFDWGELILDRALWRWRSSDAVTLTLGRQDIIWPGGFLMLEGNPYDGSRAIYHDALRVQATGEHGDLDVALIRNLKRDPVVIAGDEDRRLTDADETGVVLRLVQGRWAWSLLVKGEHDPDDVLAPLTTWTAAGRRDGAVGAGGKWHLELAAQYQNGRVESAYTSVDPGRHGLALAGEGSATLPLGDAWTLEAGGFYYSGQGESLRPFRTPWGRWPRWSELYIYTLIGESTPGRVTVAAWENIAAPVAMLRRPLGERFSVRGGAYYLLAPASSWETRGLLTEVELKADLPYGLTGHLLWEMLAPGGYHDGDNGLPPLTDTVHFLRWQVMWTL